MDTCSRRCHRRITLTSATLITPASPAQGPSGNGDYTWVKFRCKYLLQAGQYSVQFNSLIQAGGGNGLVQHETEPHSSLARVRIDLPSTLDSSFGLNVQKSAVIVPTGFEI